MDKICEYCHKPLPEHLVRFCSWECLYNSRKNPRTQRTCEICGGSFTVRLPSTRRFCSRQCYYRSRTTVEPVTCPICGKIFIPRSNRGIFCSKTCSGINQRVIGGSHRAYGSSWNAQRRKVLERDNYTCQICHKGPILSKSHHVHHIVAFRFFGLLRHNEANRTENLVVLCNSCHSRVHQGSLTCPMPLDA
jgi:Restriction endonuclease